MVGPGCLLLFSLLLLFLRSLWTSAQALLLSQSLSFLSYLANIYASCLIEREYGYNFAHYASLSDYVIAAIMHSVLYLTTKKRKKKTKKKKYRRNTYRYGYDIPEGHPLPTPFLPSSILQHPSRVLTTILAATEQCSMAITILTATLQRIILRKLGLHHSPVPLDDSILLHCFISLSFYSQVTEFDEDQALVFWLIHVGSRWHSFLMQLWTSLQIRTIHAWQCFTNIMLICQLWWTSTQRRALNKAKATITTSRQRMTLRLPHLWLVVMLSLPQIGTGQVDILSDFVNDMEQQTTRVTDKLDLSQLIATNLQAGHCGHCPLECPCLHDYGTLPTITTYASIMSEQGLCQPTVGSYSDNHDSVGMLLCGTCSEQTELTTHQQTENFSTAAKAMTLMTNDALPIVLTVDSGATSTSLASAEDFVSLQESPETKRKVIDGIAEGLQIYGEGIAEFDIVDDAGTPHCIRTHAFWVPELQKTDTQRLLSPQSVNTTSGLRATSSFHTNRSPEGGIDRDSYGELILRDPKQENWQRSTPVSYTTIPYSTRSNLPTLPCTVPSQQQRVEQHLKSAICVTDARNKNLTGPEKELLRLHFRLGHVGFRHIQWMVRHGRIQCSNPHAVANVKKLPKCASCEYGKATKRNTETQRTSPESAKEMNLKKEDLVPGQRVSVDHYVCAVPGRLPKNTSTNRESYCGGAMLVDHATRYVSIKHQSDLGGTSTSLALLEFERDSFNDGVTVQNYHTDRGVFTSAEVRDKLSRDGQGIRFSGSGAAHMNGVSEAAIGNITRMARTMMLHAVLRSPPDTLTPDLWSFSMDYAVWLYNRIPQQQTGLAPIDLWTRNVNIDHHIALNDCQVWGAPSFVLEPKLRKDGVKIPKWAPRSREGRFMGFSVEHSSLVSLILNLKTQTTTPQWHVVFDSMFSTCFADHDSVPDVWQHLITHPHCRMETLFDVDDPSSIPLIHDDWLTDDERRINANERRRRDVQRRRQNNHESRSIERETTDDDEDPVDQSDTHNANDTQDSSDPPTVETATPRSVRFADNITRTIIEEPSSPFNLRQVDEPNIPSDTSANPPLPPSPPSTRPRRNTQPVQRYTSGFEAASKWKSSNVRAMAAQLVQQHWTPTQWQQVQSLLADIDEMESSTLSPRIYAAKSGGDPLTPNYVEAMSGPHAAEFWEAMHKEIKALTKRETWELVPRSSVPEGVPIIPGTWSFKIKTRPDGSFNKFKARWCLRGDLMKKSITDAGNEVDNFSPVCQWSSIRLMLILSTIFKLETRCLDFSNAFAQAKLSDEQRIYAELPANFVTDDETDCVFLMKRSLYGSAFAAKLFYEKARDGLLRSGLNFKQSDIDPCLFISPTIIIALYIDDCCIAFSDQSDFDRLLQFFENDGDKFDWEHTVDGTLHEYLGIEINDIEDGKAVRLTQVGLIKRILNATNMENCVAKPTPTSPDGKPLGTDANGDQRKHDWSMPSVVGMLLFLANNSRADIAYAVHAVSRHTHDPKLSHETAVLRIVRYLKGTIDDGLILRPTPDNLELTLYTDAAFAGSFGLSTEDPHDPVTAKSRVGYIITFAGCPIAFSSKLSQEICLSTCESELQAFSFGMRAFIPLKGLIHEISVNFKSKLGRDAIVHQSLAHIDNSAALKLIQSGKFTARTRHLCVKLFWFLDKLKDQRLGIVPKKINGEVLIADLMTKNTKPDTFLRLRKLFCGW